MLLKRPGGDREMVEILALVLHHDEEAGAFSKPHILNLLSRLLEPAPPAPVAPPQHLRLGCEP